MWGKSGLRRKRKHFILIQTEKPLASGTNTVTQADNPPRTDSTKQVDIIMAILELKLTSIKLAYCMEQSNSWEANRFSASQESTRSLWNIKVHYRLHKITPLVSVLRKNESMPHPPTLFLQLHHQRQGTREFFGFICLHDSPSLPLSTYIAAVSFNAFTLLPKNCVYRSLLILFESSFFTAHSNLLLHILFSLTSWHDSWSYNVHSSFKMSSESLYFWEIENSLII
jgi:hypothetical protein